jgi:hypothetical protein
MLEKDVEMKNLITCLVVSVLSGMALADTWTVDDDGKADFNNIQAAVDAASDGDEIIVAPGTYTSNGSTVVSVQDKSLWLHSSGGYSVTKIDGEGQNMCLSLSNSDSTIEGFKFKNGYGAFVGGMYINESDATVNNCLFDNNYGAIIAGGLVASASNVVISNTDFYDSTSNFTGGVAIGGNCSLSNCVISGNTGNLYAGGITVLEGNVSMDQCTVEWNGGTIAGGIWIDGNATHLNLTDCNVWGNTSDNEENKGILVTDSARVQMYGANVVDNTYVEDSGSVAAFQAGSVCTMVGPYSPTYDATTVLDVDAFGADAPLQLTGTLRKNGCLSITNESGSLSGSLEGHEISIFEFGQAEGGNGSVVFPVMPDGLGLRFIAGPIDGGSTIRVKIKVIEVEDVEFNDPIPTDLSGAVVDIVSFDADGDGDDELAILYDGSPGAVTVYEVSDDGSPPSEIAGFAAFVGNKPVDLDTGDLNGDGLEDLIVANAYDASITVLTTSLAEGTLSFSTSTIRVPGTNQAATCAAVIDWGGDLNLDIVVGVSTSDNSEPDGYRVLNDVSTSSATSGPWFEVPDYEVSPDEFVSDPPTAVDGVRGTNSAWGFVGGTRYGRIHRVIPSESPLLQLLNELNGNNISLIEALDLDDYPGDGQLDLLVASDDAHSIYIFQGDADETDGFGDVIPIYISVPVVDVVAIDTNEDGDKDFLIAAPDSDTPLLLLRNDGSNGLLPDGLGGRTWSLQTMDVNYVVQALTGGGLSTKDEEDRIVVVAGNEHSVRGETEYLMEQTNFFIPCPVDLTDDDVVGVDDLLLLIAAWGSCDACPEDLNADGVVDVNDLLLVIAAWGPCE